MVHLYSHQDIFEFLLSNEQPYMVLGGGSNVLFTQDFDGVVLKNEIKGYEIIDEDEEQLLVKVGAGENWHHFVLWTVAHQLWGLENLSLIPGSVGAAPMQNIGAYGTEQNNCFHSLTAINLQEGTTEVYYKNDCNFGYRESVFKHELKNKVIITHVCYLLSKVAKPNLNYKDVQEKIGHLSSPTIKEISDAIIEIRQTKLPDPLKLGNAGSFFKNPVVSKLHFEKLFQDNPEMPHYPSGDDIKIPAAWLIDQCGFKGKVIGNTGNHSKQALVIVNYGNASGSEIYHHAKNIQDIVKQKYEITLEMEVNII
jgi:UDP-N-acetylmuramate dehydrogenase